MKKYIIIILISTIVLYSCNKELSYGEQLIKAGKVRLTIDTRSYRADVISGKYVKSESNKSAFSLNANITINEDFEERKVYFDRFNNILFEDGFGSTAIYHYSNPSQHELMKVQYNGMFGNTEYIYVRDEYGTLIEEKEINGQGIVQFSKKYIYDDYNRLTKAVIRKYDRKYITEFGSTQKGNALIENIEKTTSYFHDGRLRTTILYKTMNKRSNKLESIYKEVYIENELDIKKTINYEYDFYGAIKKESFYGWKHKGVAVPKNNSKALIPTIDHYKDQIDQYVMLFDQYGNPTKYRTIFNGNTKPSVINQLIDRDISDNLSESIDILQFDCKYYYVGEVWVKAELSLLIRPGETEYYIIERDIEYHQ